MPYRPVIGKDKRRKVSKKEFTVGTPTEAYDIITGDPVLKLGVNRLGYHVAPIMKLPFRTWLSKTPTLDTTSSQNLFTLTPFSLFDIDSDSGTSTTQPYGFDQWNTFYERWRVMGVRLRMKFIMGNTFASNADFGYYIIVVVKQDGNSVTNLTPGSMTPQTLRHHGHDQKVYYKYIPPAVSISSASNGKRSGDVVKFDIALQGHRLWKVDKAEYVMDDQYASSVWGTELGEPTAKPHVQVMIMTGDGSAWSVTPDGQVRCEIDLIQHARLDERVTYTESTGPVE